MDPFEASMSIREKRQLINSQIAVHEAAILALKRSWNAIQTLPPEVLSHIFSLVRDGTLFDSGRHPSFKWIYVSHVCSRWRGVALSFPKLWSYIDMSHPSAPTLLERCSNGPLDLYFHGDLVNTPRSELWRTAMGQLSRIREININAFRNARSNVIATLAANLEMPASALEVLRVFLSNPWLEETPYLERQMPMLRSLDLTHCIISRPLPSFPLLTSLSLTRVMRSATDLDWGLPLPYVMECLRSMPRLEQLSLRNTLTPIPAAEINDLRERKVKLLKLASLNLVSEHFSCAEVCDVLEYPLDTSVSLTLDDISLEQSTFSSIIAVCSRLKNSKAPRIHRLRIDVASSFHFIFQVYGQSDKLLVYLDLSSLDNDQLFPTCNQPLFEAMSLENVSLLRVNMARISGFEGWSAFLAPFSRVETIEARLSHADPQLCRTLLDAISSDHNCVPKLRDLVLRNVSISLPQSTDKPDFIFPKIIDLLRTRKRAELPISRLQFVDCDIDSAVKQAFKMETFFLRCTEISWTGVRQPSPYPEDDF